MAIDTGKLTHLLATIGIVGSAGYFIFRKNPNKSKYNAESYVFPKGKRYPIYNLKKAKRALIFSTWPDNKKDAKKVRSAVFKKYPKLRHWFKGGKYAAESFGAEVMMDFRCPYCDWDVGQRIEDNIEDVRWLNERDIPNEVKCIHCGKESKLTNEGGGYYYDYDAESFSAEPFDIECSDCGGILNPHPSRGPYKPDYLCDCEGFITECANCGGQLYGDLPCGCKFGAEEFEANGSMGEEPPYDGDNPHAEYSCNICARPYEWSRISRALVQHYLKESKNGTLGWKAKDNPDGARKTARNLAGFELYWYGLGALEHYLAEGKMSKLTPLVVELLRKAIVPSIIVGDVVQFIESLEIEGVDDTEPKFPSEFGEEFMAEDELGFKEWADQEDITHEKKTSFKEWADDEEEKHGDISFDEWVDHEEESHIARYGAESFSAEGEWILSCKERITGFGKWPNKRGYCDGGIYEYRELVSPPIYKYTQYCDGDCGYQDEWEDEDEYFNDAESFEANSLGDYIPAGDYMITYKTSPIKLTWEGGTRWDFNDTWTDILWEQLDVKIKKDEKLLSLFAEDRIFNEEHGDHEHEEIEILMEKLDKLTQFCINYLHDGAYGGDSQGIKVDEVRGITEEKILYVEGSLELKFVNDKEGNNIAIRAQYTNDPLSPIIYLPATSTVLRKPDDPRGGGHDHDHDDDHDHHEAEGLSCSVCGNTQEQIIYHDPWLEGTDFVSSIWLCPKCHQKAIETRKIYHAEEDKKKRY